MKKQQETAYGQQAEKCGIAVLLYFVTLAISLHQLWMNCDQESIITRQNGNLVRDEFCAIRGYDCTKPGERICQDKTSCILFTATRREQQWQRTNHVDDI